MGKIKGLNRELYCPKCNKALKFVSESTTFEGILVQLFGCKCKCLFERHVLFNKMGLVNSDTLYEKGFKDFWRGT